MLIPRRRSLYQYYTCTFSADDEVIAAQNIFGILLDIMHESKY